MQSPAVRIIGVEYLQNLPILVGLMAALKTPEWGLSLLFAALGAFGTALTISLTERLKLAQQVSEHPTPFLVNGITFLIGSCLYLAYFRLIRSSSGTPLLVDLAVGGVLGLLIGLAQGYGRGLGRLDRSDIAHIVGLMLAGAALCAVIGLIADSWSAFVAAPVLCIVMTLLIVRLDYWQLITASSPQS